MYAVGLSVMLLLVETDSPPAFSLPPDTQVEARAMVGAGTGTLEVRDGNINIQASAKSSGAYTENWRMDAAVLDFVLPQSVVLPADAKRLAFNYRLRMEGGKGQTVALRTLITDARGGVWAVGIRRGARRSQLEPLAHFVSSETYAFDVNEAGRIDPWVMMPLDPEKFDAYDAPQPPFRLSGFRVIVEKPNTEPYSILLRGMEAMDAARLSDPYWALIPQRTWAWRRHIAPLPAQEAHGWGAADAEPELSAAEMGLRPGGYSLTWEVLPADGGAALASDAGHVEVETPEMVVVRLPMLGPGTYQLRVGVRGDGDKPYREAFYEYVVLRNASSRARVLAQGKPLRYEPVAKGMGRIISQANEGSIAWRVESADQRVLKEGKASADKPLTLDLNPWRGKESAVWVSARLVDEGGKVRDGLHRIVGLDNVARPREGRHGSEPGGKLAAALSGSLLRSKGDWAEGATPAAALSSETLKNLGPWLDEAKTIGYNSVELSAAWDDLNPAPGIYQFEYLDQLVDAARDRGLFVTLRVHPRDALTPAWVKRHYMQDGNGFAHGLWQGGGTLIPSPSSPSLRRSLDDFLTALGAHYRDDHTVVGYVLESLFFDHDLADMPWQGQYVDYSEAARGAFHRYLRKRYDNDLASLNRAHHASYGQWEDVPMPRPGLRWDAEGRLRPRTEPAWRDWCDFKIGEIRDFRLGGVTALRQADPGCWIGLYASDTTGFYKDRIAANGCWMTYGSMEASYPVENTGLHGRYEPHGKIARTATLVDVGMSNILMSAPPGYHAFFNYWFLHKTLATASPAERDGEERLRRWFPIVDRLVGARPVGDDRDRHLPAVLVSFSGQLPLLQHAFLGRSEDYLKPWRFRIGADRVRVADVEEGEELASGLSGRPYIYIPYSTAVLDTQTLDALQRYVQNGGNLIMEATSGFWVNDVSNALGNSLGIPEAKPVADKGPEPRETAVWTKDSPLKGTPLNFRTQEFKPPINDQPTPWIQNIPRAFLRPYRLSGAPPNGAAVLARYEDGEPAALLSQVGRGRVLFLAGVVDWLSSEGLAKSLDAWGRGLSQALAAEGEPELVTQTLCKNGTYYVIGRRFIGQDDIEQRKQTDDMVPTTPKSLSVCWQADGAMRGAYHVRELLGGLDLGILSASALSERGVTLDLSPGQAFVLEAQPQ